MLAKLFNKITTRAESINYPYQTFGIFGLFTYLGYYFLWEYLGSYGYNSLVLRLIVCALCIPLIFVNSWPRSLKKFLPIYWYLTILYSLPFLFTFLLFKNDISYAAILNSLITLALTILILDLASFLVLLVIGSFLGWLTFYLTTPHVVHPFNDYLNIIIYHFSLIFFGAIFAHRKEQIQAEKLNSLITLSGSIAHELRTPLRAIDSNNDGLIKLLPHLTQAYTVAKEHQLNIPFIPPQQFIALDHLTESIKLETYAAFTFIDMLLLKTKSSGEGQEQHDYSMRACIETAIARYPLSEEERSSIVIKLTGEDFIFHANDYFVMHIFFNLIKNAIYYIHKAQKGDIQIWLEPGEPFNTVHFKDTGTGIAKRDLSRVFERFFSRTHRGTGLGLAFSKMVMESIGGKIACQSVLGEYTEFILRFPVVKRTT